MKLQAYQIYFTLYLTHMCIFALFAQNPTVALSPEIKPDKKEHFIKFLHSDSTGYYMLWEQRFKKNTILNITKYNKQWAIAYRKSHMINDGYIDYKSIFHLNDGLLICTHKKDNKKLSISYHMTYLASDGSTSKSQPVATVDYTSPYQIPRSFWTLSNDSSKVLLAILNNENGSEKPTISITVTDNRGQKLWDKKISMAHGEKEIDIDSWAISNDGVVYMLAKIFPEGKAEMYCEVYRYSDIESEQSKAYKIDFGLDPPTYVSGKIDENGTFYCSGLYPQKKNDFSGVFYTRINSKTDQVESNIKHKFTAADWVNTPQNDKHSSEEINLGSNLVYRDILPQADGSLLIMAERYFTKDITTRSRTVAVIDVRTTTNYYAYDIFNFMLRPDGTLAWLTVIPKKQIDTNPAFLSYARTSDTAGNIHLFYNDNAKNNTQLLDRPAKPLKHGKLGIALTTLTPDGKTKRTILEQVTDTKLSILPQLCAPAGTNKMFLLLAKYPKVGKPSYRFGIVDL